jgi:hypothetical protein
MSMCVKLRMTWFLDFDHHPVNEVTGKRSFEDCVCYCVQVRGGAYVLCSVSSKEITSVSGPGDLTGLGRARLPNQSKTPSF